MITCRSKCSKGPTTLFPVVDIVVVMVYYSCSTCRREPRMTICFLLVFLWRIKHSIPERIHSELKAAVLSGEEGALFLKNTERNFRYVRCESIPISFGAPKDRPMERHIRRMSLV